VYIVSRLGVTGTGSEPDFTPMHGQIAMMREVTSKPLAVGFGISRPEHVREVSQLADGFIVGSALIDAYAGKTREAAAASIRAFTAPLIAAAASG
jgi:tryptophan synthase alpha chain